MGEIQRAVVLLSGGLDSTTTLAIAKAAGFEACAMTFRYGQRHKIEIEAAQKIARRFGVSEETWMRLIVSDDGVPVVDAN